MAPPPPTPPPGDQARQAALDGALLTRLLRRAEQPGCVRHGQARALLARHRRMAGEPPLAGPLLRRGHGTDIEPSGQLIVAARPVAAPGAGPPQAPVPDRQRSPARGARPPQASPPGAAAPRATGPSAAPRPAVRARPARPDDQPYPPLPGAPAPAGPAGLPSPLQPARSVPAPAAGTLTSQAGSLSAAGQAGPAAHPGAPRPDPAPSGVPASARPASAPPVATASAARPVVTVPAARPFSSAPARLVPGPAAMPLGTGPTPAAGEDRRPVVRAGADGRATTLAWPRLAPERADATGRPAPPPVPVVRERVSPQGAWRSGLAAPQWPAMPPRPVPSAAGPAVTVPVLVPGPVPGPAGSAAPARPGDPARAAGDPSRTPPAELSGRRADRREPARPGLPQIELNRIVSTVQRRLTHQMAIERERRGMRR